MPKLPRITGRELVKALQEESFEITRRKGSHVQLTKYVGGKKLTSRFLCIPARSLNKAH